MARGGAGRATVTLPACLSETAMGGPLPSGRAALAGGVPDPYGHTTDWVTRERREEPCADGEHGEGRTLVREVTQTYNGRGDDGRRAGRGRLAGPDRRLPGRLQPVGALHAGVPLGRRRAARPAHGGPRGLAAAADGDGRRREPGRARVRLDQLLERRGPAPAAHAGGERDAARGGADGGLSGGLHREPRVPAHGDPALDALSLGRGAGDADDLRGLDRRERRLPGGGPARLGRPRPRRSGRPRPRRSGRPRPRRSGRPRPRRSGRPRPRRSGRPRPRRSGRPRPRRSRRPRPRRSRRPRPRRSGRPRPRRSGRTGRRRHGRAGRAAARAGRAAAARAGRAATPAAAIPTARPPRAAAAPTAAPAGEPAAAAEAAAS